MENPIEQAYNIIFDPQFDPKDRALMKHLSMLLASDSWDVEEIRRNVFAADFDPTDRCTMKHLFKLFGGIMD